MIEKLQRKYEERISYLLETYATEREKQNKSFTGQFIDQVGVKKSQYGIYGMAVFNFLASDHNSISIELLKEQNTKKLKEWINITNDYSISSDDANDFLNSDPYSYVYELRNVLPKIIFACNCLHKIDPHCEEYLILRKRVNDSRHNDYGYSFLINTGITTESNIFATSQVVRAFFKEDPTSNIQTIDFLLSKVSDNPKASEILKHLYILNSIQIFLLQNPRYLKKDKYKSVKDMILTLLKKLFKHVDINPVSFANPINVDFNDFGRTRYFRLYSDLIVLESLIILNQSKLHFVFGRLGKILMTRIDESLETNFPFPKDTTDHRMSFGFLAQLSTIIELLNPSQNHNVNSFWSRLHGRIIRLYHFGIDIVEEVVLTIIPTLLGIAIFWMKADSFVAPWFAYMAARLGSFISLLFKKRRKDRF